MFRMRVPVSSAPKATASLVSTTSEVPMSSLILQRFNEVRDSLSDLRTDVARNANSISSLRTMTDGMLIDDIKLMGRIDKCETDIAAMNGTIGTVAVADVVPQLDVMLKELEDMKGVVNTIIETIPQDVVSQSDVAVLMTSLDENADKIAELQGNIHTLSSNVATLNISTDETAKSLGDAIAYAGTQIDTLSEELRKVSTGVGSQLQVNPLPTLFNAVSPVCSTVVMTFAPYGSSDGGMFSGSGSFITLSDSDLKDGLFLTCAHNIIESVDGSVKSIQEAYIENPLNGQWLRVTRNMVFVDGVGDIALIKTGINFNGSTVKPLKLAIDAAKTGDQCVVVGDPAMVDSDSMSSGIIRSARYEMKPFAYQINECIHIDAPTVGGNSGSPIMNTDGEIIGMLTYGQDGASTLGGGPNLSSLKKSLSVLSTFKNNNIKRYIGLIWGVVYPTTLFQLKSRNPSLIPTTSGVQVYQVNYLSPFYGSIRTGDIILTVQVFGANGQTITPVYTIGVHDGEMPFGFLLYEYAAASLTITYISGQSGVINTKTIPFTKTYADVPDTYDVPLSTGLKTPIKQVRFD